MAEEEGEEAEVVAIIKADGAATTKMRSTVETGGEMATMSVATLMDITRGIMEEMRKERKEKKESVRSMTRSMDLMSM